MNRNRRMLHLQSDFDLVSLLSHSQCFDSMVLVQCLEKHLCHYLNLNHVEVGKSPMRFVFDKRSHTERDGDVRDF